MKILVSACLLGHNVRYDGKNCIQHHPKLKRWIEKGNVISICPEVSGGLPVPRLPAEIIGEGGGIGVWNHTAKVVDIEGSDVTSNFTAGAKNALELVYKHHIKIAILKEGSPSCATHNLHDGTFSGTKINGFGVTAILLKQAGVSIYSEKQLDEAMDMAEKLSATHV